MSGGTFDYIQYRLEDVIDQIKESKLDSIYGTAELKEQIQDEFDNSLHVINLAKIYIQRIDYLLAGDDSEESFLERLHEDIKAYQKGEQS